MAIGKAASWVPSQPRRYPDHGVLFEWPETLCIHYDPALQLDGSLGSESCELTLPVWELREQLKF